MSDPEACKFHQEAVEANDVLVWTVYDSPRDFPGVFVARPFSAMAAAPCYFTITAKTLGEIRNLLPPGLTFMPRQNGDDPAIVETWI